MKTDPVTVGADTTVYVWLLCQMNANRGQTYNVPSSPAVTGLVFYAEIQHFLRQCRVLVGYLI